MRTTPALVIAALTLAAPASASAASVRADFNKDGYGDLAVGAPWEDLGSSENPIPLAGVVNVVYGGPDGLDSGPAAQQFAQHQLGGASEARDWFGSALAAGDYNSDGFTDLAVGTPSEGVVSGGVLRQYAGAVTLIYGGSTGLSAAGARHINQYHAGGTVGYQDFFGGALAAGDFDGDGRTDLAVGAAEEDFGDTYNGGAVNVLYSDGSGGFSRTQQFDQSDAGGATEWVDRFGETLASGDFDANGVADLAVGAPSEESGRGVVNVLYGTEALGLRSTGARQFTQRDAGGLSEPGDGWGLGLAAGDFDGDGDSDLAAGAHHDELVIGGANIIEAGVVNVLYGAPTTGLSSAGARQFAQYQLGGQSERYDEFGLSVTSGDFDSDGFADLAVGAQGEDSSGQVNVIRGSGAGLTSTGAHRFHQGQAGGRKEFFDHFGRGLAANDFDADGFDDLAAGAPDEAMGASPQLVVGAFNVLYGSGTGGLTSVDARQFMQYQLGGRSEQRDRFGEQMSGG
jgi:FG-GAP repeat